MEAKAVAKYVRMSPIKLKPVADLVRGKDLNEALTILRFTPGKGAEIFEKVVKSAAATAAARLRQGVFFQVPRVQGAAKEIGLVFQRAALSVLVKSLRREVPGGPVPVVGAAEQAGELLGAFHPHDLSAFFRGGAVRHRGRLRDRPEAGRRTL